MPVWAIVVIAYPPAMGVASLLALRAMRRAGGYWWPFRGSVGDQAERWLQAYNEL